MSYIEYAHLLYKKAQEMGLNPKWLTDYGLFSISVDGKIGYVTYTYSLLNSHLGAYLSKNKHATRVILDSFHFPNIPYALPETLQEVQLFLRMHKKIVAKPTQGTGSHDVHIITELEELKDIVLQNYIFEKFIIGKEVRYLIFKNKVIGVYEKQDIGPIGNPTEKRRISYPKEQWDQDLVTMALDIVKKLYLKIATVDFLITNEGKVYILEVNSSPGIVFVENPSVGPSVDIARMFLEELIKDIKEYNR